MWSRDPKAVTEGGRLITEEREYSRKRDQHVQRPRGGVTSGIFEQQGVTCVTTAE